MLCMAEVTGIKIAEALSLYARLLAILSRISCNETGLDIGRYIREGRITSMAYSYVVHYNILVQFFRFTRYIN